MEHSQNDFVEENKYLERTLEVIDKELEKATESFEGKKKGLISSRKEMWEDTAHFSTDFERLTEINQHLTEIANKTAVVGNVQKRLQSLKRMKGSSYFGRFDFTEDGSDEIEKVYIGVGNLTDSNTQTIFVYDWRAPISSIFYGFEPGKASYKAPFGEVKGEVGLKRQYKIHNSKLKYFFDCNTRINDEILQEVLRRNSSPKMRNIVETLQKEQDKIIRDTERELLLVQGVAGSGKTSIAMHRVAFLLYEGINSKLESDNILIISPNTLLAKYITDVLPELGEENVQQATVEEIFNNYFENNLLLNEGRNSQLEALISCGNEPEREFIAECIDFKGSEAFKTILDRLIKYYEHKVIQFQDIYYDGIIVENKQLLKSYFLGDKLGTPMAKRLKKLESRILEKIKPLSKKRLEKIEAIVQKSDGHEFEIKPFSRLLAIKENKTFIKRIRRFTEVDPLKLYKMLYSNPQLFHKLAGGMGLPKRIDKLLACTRERLDNGQLNYEDALPLLYLKLKVEGNTKYSEIRHIVIDEAQDYYPIHFEVFKLIFRNARYTVMGDISQTLEKDTPILIYKKIIEILDKPKSTFISLNKSYRASYEINCFSHKILGEPQNFDSFDRHEEEPQITYRETQNELEDILIEDIYGCIEKGFESIAVICRSRVDAEELFLKIKEKVEVKLIVSNSDEIDRGVIITPGYMTKGLEFDAVLVYGVDSSNYSSEFDRKLLYIACTRALHYLKLYYSGKECKFLET